MPDCPVCRRSFDDRFSVFAPPSAEPFDTIECARRAARASSGAADATPLILPTIDVLTSLGGQAKAVQAREPAIGAGLRGRAPVSVAVVAGLSLVAVGTASSLYLWSGLPQSGGQARRTAAPLTAPPAAVTDAAIPPALPQGPSTRDTGRAAAEPVAVTSTQPASSSEAAGTSSSEAAGTSNALVEPTAASPPPQSPPSGPAPATQPPEPPPPTSPPNRPQPSPQPPSQPAPPPAPNSPPSNRPQPAQPLPTGGENPAVAGAGHVGSTPSTSPSSPTHDDDDGGAKPKKPKKPKRPNTPPAVRPPAPPPAAIPAVPATPAQPPAQAEDQGDQHGAPEPQGNGNGSQRNGNGNGNGKKP